MPWVWRGVRSGAGKRLATTMSSISSDRHTAGIIVIGDEVLKGQVRDTNSHFLCRELTRLGVQVQKISVLGDNVEQIAEEVKVFSQTYTHVLTSGGIGPTHDDLTFEAVAKAFDVPLEMHPQLQAFCKEWFKTDDLSSPVFKLSMASVPKTASLNYGEDREKGVKSRFPLISVKNVFIFPGIPQLLERAMTLLGGKLFHNPAYTRHMEDVYLRADEVTIAPSLNQAVNQFPEVTFGSYPVIHHSYYQVQVTMECEDNARLSQAKQYFINLLSPEYVLKYDRNPVLDGWEKVKAFSEKEADDVQRGHISQALEILKKAYEMYRPEELCVFFNGGKDCTAVLHLVSSYVFHHFPGHRLKVVHIRNPGAFPQLQAFIEETIIRYNLELVELSGTIKEGLRSFLSENPGIKGGFLGMRNADPGAVHQQEFTPTDSNWPSLMRINPIFSWPYKEVWRFIRCLCLPYCSLYDRGYTSLGCALTTQPNPALQITLPSGHVTFDPAHKLQDDNLERRGRQQLPTSP